jgi:hypothetical protein
MIIKKILAAAAVLLLALYLAPYLVGQEASHAPLVRHARSSLAVIPTGIADPAAPLRYRLSAPARMDVQGTGVGVLLDSLEPAVYTVTVENATHRGVATVLIEPGDEAVLRLALAPIFPHTQLARFTVLEARTREPMPNMEVWVGTTGPVWTDDEGCATFLALPRGITRSTVQVRSGDSVMAQADVWIGYDSARAYQIVLGTRRGLPVTAGLLAWYPLEGLSPEIEAGPFGRHAERQTNRPETAPDRYGAAGGAVRFNGTAQAITIPHAEWQLNTPFSVSFWIRAEQATAQTAMFLGKYRHATGQGWLVFYENGLLCAAQISNGFATYSRVNTATSVDGRWHHVVLTVDTDKLVMYVDGARVPANTARQAIPKVATDEPIRIGRIRSDMWPDHPGLIGAMDDVAFYDRILTDAEILLLGR